MPKITIYVDAEGNFKYENAVQHAKPGEDVLWESLDGDFAVCFGERTPFQGAFEFYSLAGRTLPAKIDANAVGPYSYVVAIRTKEGMFIDGGCPIIKIP